MPDVIQRLRRTAECRAGHPDLFPADPEHQYRRTLVEESVSIHAAIQRHRCALSNRAGDAREDVEALGAERRRHRPLHQEPADVGRGRSRDRRRLMASPSIRCARNSTTPSAPARSRRSTRRRWTIRSFWKASRNSRPIRPRLSKIYLKTSAVNAKHNPAAGGGVERCRQSDRPDNSALRRDEACADRRSAAGQSSGPAALGHHLVQPSARHLARSGGRAGSAA